MLEMGVTFSASQLMMDAEMAEMILYAAGGIPVNDGTLSVDVTKEVGYKKDFLTHRNTFNNRNIQSKPRLIDRQMRNRWEDSGSTSMPERANLLAKKVLAEHFPPPLEESARLAIRKIVNDREKELGLDPSEG
jgi:trimethylamine--corrinoid protein Co-methyltransferase